MKKILLIEDGNTGVLPLMEKIKINCKADVFWCRSVEWVFPKLIYYKFDLIILDIMMPPPESWSFEERKEAESGLSTGLVLLNNIRAKYESIPILIYSAKEIEIALDEFTFYRRKPLLSTEFCNLLLSLFEKYPTIK